MSRKRFFRPLIMWEGNQKKVRFLCQGRVGLSMVNNNSPVKTQIVHQSFSFCAWSQSRVHCSRMLSSISKKTSLYLLMNGELSSGSVIHPVLIYWRQVELVLPWSKLLGWFLLLLILLQERRKKVYSSLAPFFYSLYHPKRKLPRFVRLVHSFYMLLHYCYLVLTLQTHLLRITFILCLLKYFWSLIQFRGHSISVWME